MKKLILFALFLTVANLSFGQYALSPGQGQFNAGLGFSNHGLPVYVGFDVGVHPDISVGGELSFRSYDANYRGDNYHHSIFGVSANGNYHFNTLLDIPEQWDFYAGLNLGFYFWNNDDDYDGNDNSGLGLGAQVGGRYYFTDKFGINLEIGGANVVSGGKFGITLKF